jgi:putative transposase
MAIKTHKIELALNNKQNNHMNKCFGVKRVAYNYGLSRWKEKYEAGEKVNEGIIRKELNEIKAEKFPYMYEVSKSAVQHAVKDLGVAFSNFFAGRAGYPKFKKKYVKDSFRICNDQYSIIGKYIKLPHIGKIKMTEEVRFKGKLLNATITREADRVYISIPVEVAKEEVQVRNNDENQVVGVDLGITHLATLSTGIQIPNSARLKKLLNEVKQLNRSLSRKQGGKKGIKSSNNYKKAKEKLAKLHRQIVNIRNDILHKITTMLADNFDVICIEDLNVTGMLKNHKLARAIQNCGFGRFRILLESKTKARGKTVIIVDRFFPSSKLCSNCNEKNTSLTLSDREWVCSICNAKHDRDVNAAINLKNKAVSYTATACGESKDSFMSNDSLKQELSIKSMIK